MGFGSMRFWLVDLARGTRVLALLRELERLQFAAPSVLASRQRALRERYAALVRRASPLYRQYAGFDQFPVIDKDWANRHRASLVNPHYRGRLVRKKTGGSTGQPFVYSTGTLAQSYLWAAILLSWRVTGYRLGEPVAIFAGSALFGSGRRHKLFYALMNVRLLSAFDLSAAHLDACCTRLARERCRLLYGYAAAIHRLACHLRDSGLQLRFHLRAIVCTAEVLTEAMRATISTAFGVPCFNQYGCNDAGVSAYECERRDGLHLITERCWHEVQDDGRLLATDLANDAFFLPRYDTGDRVALAAAPCPCGRGFPLIASLLGRANDLVADAHGNSVHSEFFTHLFRENTCIAAFQVVYDQSALVIIVHARGHVDQHAYLQRIGAALRFASVRFAENRPFIATANGKHRFVLRVDNVERELGA